MLKESTLYIFFIHALGYGCQDLLVIEEIDLYLKKKKFFYGKSILKMKSYKNWDT